MREACHPSVMAMFRLAITEAEHAPEVARALDAAGRVPTRVALSDLLAYAQSKELLGAGDPLEMARQYLALLWEDLQMRLLLRLVEPPDHAEITQRAHKATAAFLSLYTA